MQTSSKTNDTNDGHEEMQFVMVEEEEQTTAITSSCGDDHGEPDKARASHASWWATTTPFAVSTAALAMAMLLAGGTVCLILNSTTTPTTVNDGSLDLSSSSSLWSHAVRQLGAKEMTTSSSGSFLAFSSLTVWDYWGFFFATVGLMVAAGGGIGGGGILVPIYILIMGFSPKHAIPLSSVTVFGGALANLLLNARKRHPLTDRPLMDWDLIVMMEPLTIVGVLLGAFLNKLLPELLLTILLVALLSFTSWESLSKAVQLYKKETAALLKQQSSLQEEQQQQSNRTLKSSNGSSEVTPLVAPTNNNNNPYNNSNDNKNIGDEEEPVDEQLAALLQSERTVPITNVIIMIVMYGVVLAVNLLKGGGAFRSPLGIVCGSTAFWLANLFLLVWILAVAAGVRVLVLSKWQRKQRVGYHYVEGDIEWNPRATVLYPAVCCAAGFFAGMFGVGGGIVQGPLMLSMGVHPAVASATLACLILFTSFAATTSFLVFGLLLTDYAVICFVIGFVATCLGQAVLSAVMKRNKRNSYIAFCIGTVVLLSAILMTIQSVLAMLAGEHHSSGGVCGMEH